MYFAVKEVDYKADAKRWKLQQKEKDREIKRRKQEGTYDYDKEAREKKIEQILNEEPTQEDKDIISKSIEERQLSVTKSLEELVKTATKVNLKAWAQHRIAEDQKSENERKANNRSHYDQQCYDRQQTDIEVKKAVEEVEKEEEEEREERRRRGIKEEDEDEDDEEEEEEEIQEAY